MGSWFTHPVQNIDAEAEGDAARGRDEEAWAILISRLVDVVIDPEGSLKEDFIAGAPHLGFFQSGAEAVVYRLLGEQKSLQVVVMGRVKGSMDGGSLISEAQRRCRL
jgi:hypothetical protein